MIFDLDMVNATRLGFEVLGLALTLTLMTFDLDVINAIELG